MLKPKKTVVPTVASKKVIKDTKSKAPAIKVDVSKPKLITSKTKSTARSIRTTARNNADGTQSTHKMQTGEGEGKYKYQVTPTIFPNSDGTWKDTGRGKESFNEARKRGEVFGFKTEKKAEKFAYGSWKQGKDRREAMKEYRANKKLK